MKSWLPRDEELSDGWHTALTFLLVGFFAVPFLYSGAEAIITRSFDPEDFWFGAGYKPPHMEMMHGFRAFLAGLAQFDAAAIFLLIGFSTSRHVRRTNLVFGLAVAAAMIYVIATSELPVETY
jgi:hypothetical protein